MSKGAKVFAFGAAGAVAIAVLYILTRPAAVAKGKFDGVEYTREGEMAELSLTQPQVSPKVQAQIEEVLTRMLGEEHHQVPIPFGRTVRCAVTWTNIGTVAGARDVISLYGRYDAATRTFNIYFGSVVKNVSLAAGASVTTNVDTVCNQAPMIGTWDGLAVVGVYNETTGEITMDDSRLKAAAITVQAPAVPTGRITEAAYSVV